MSKLNAMPKVRPSPDQLVFELKIYQDKLMDSGNIQVQLLERVYETFKHDLPNPSAFPSFQINVVSKPDHSGCNPFGFKHCL